MTEKESERQRHTEPFIAWMTALGSHLVLLVLFAFYQIGWEYVVPEWIEMEVLSVKRAVSQPAAVETAAAAASSQPITPQRVINLPKRRMLEDEPPTLREQNRPEIKSAEETTAKSLEAKYAAGRVELETAAPPPQTKSSVDLQAVPSGQRAEQATLEDLGRGITVPYQIEGEAANRVVLQKVIPEYPSGLRREALVRISFVVLPSGVVARTIPILKGDAVLERVAIDAFRQWRFNALPEDVAQKEQQGIITFRFVLR